VKLTGPAGVEVVLGPVTAGAEKSVTADIQGDLVPGDYTVAWQTGAADGHPTRGRYGFTILAGAAMNPADTARGASNDTASASPSPAQRGNALVGAPLDSSVSAPREQGAERWVEFVALLTVIGVACFRFFVVPSVSRQGMPTADLLDSALRLGRASLLLLFVAMWVRLYMEMRAIFGDRAGIGATLRDTLISTSWGHGWLLGAAGVIVAAIGFAGARRASAGWLVAGLGTLMIGMTPAFTGHAIATPVAGGWALVADTLHVLCAGAWIGTLATIVLAVLPALRARESATGERAFGTSLLAVVRAFNPVALTAAAILVLTGVISARYRVGTIAALLGTGYGQLLLAKIALVLVVAAAGAWNWRRLTPTLGDDASALRLRRSAMLELTVAALVLAVTSALVVTSPPAHASVSAASSPSMR
jgi:putative copper export protein